MPQNAICNLHFYNSLLNKLHKCNGRGQMVCMCVWGFVFFGGGSRPGGDPALTQVGKLACLCHHKTPRSA